MPRTAIPYACVEIVADESVTVYVNGKAVQPKAVLAVPAKKKATTEPPSVPRRAPFEVAVPAGESVIAVRVDNRKISELFLGGILRPVVLIEKGNQ